MDNLESEVSLADVLQVWFDSYDRQVGVALPGNVVSYDAGTQTATVRPGVNRLLPAEDDPETLESESLPALQNVPVCWPRGRNFQIIGTLQAGDPVLLVCMDRDISGWRANNSVSDPNDSRMHHWGSAVAIPGLLPNSGAFSPAPTDALALASVVDKILDTLRTCSPAGAETGLAAIKAALIVATYPATTSASAVVKVSS